MNAATAAEKLLESGAGRWLLDLGPWGGRHSKENGMKNSKKREWTAGVQKSTEYNTAYASFFCLFTLLTMPIRKEYLIILKTHSCTIKAGLWIYFDK